MTTSEQTATGADPGDEAMIQRNDPSALRWLIGNELRRIRLATGRTQTEAGEAVGCSQTKINHLETGRNQQRPDEVTALMWYYGTNVAQVDRLASLAARADQGTWWASFSDVVPDWLRTFVGLEGLASHEFAYEPLLIPGLLQTRDYAAALLVDHLRVAAVESERVVRLRMARQERLNDPENPLRIHAILEETTLDRMVGGSEVMAPQLRHLLDLFELDNVTVQVMPQSVAVHDGLEGEFALLDFAEAQSVGYVEFPDGAVYAQDQDKVAAYTQSRERMAQAALPEGKSAEAIRARLEALNRTEE